MLNLKFSRTRTLALTLLTLAACTGGDDGTRKGPDAGTGGNGAQDDGGDSAGDDGAVASGRDAASGGPGGNPGDASNTPVTPGVEPACSDTQVRCRGACFDKVGQVKNGCEWVAEDRERLRLASLASIPGAVFASKAPDDWMIFRIDTGDFSVKMLDQLSRDGKVYGVQDGWLYYGFGVHVRRVPVEGGASMEVLTLTNADVDQAQLHGAHLYASSNGSLWRVPLAGGTQEELITEGIGSFAVDANYIYSSGTNLSVQRRALANPTQAENIFYDAKQTGLQLFMLASEPNDLFWLDNEANQDFLRSVLRSGGQAKTLYSLESTRLPPGSASLVSTGQSFAYSFLASKQGTSAKQGIDILSADGKARVAIDSDLMKPSDTVAEDASYFYLARDRALFRIAKSNF